MARRYKATSDNGVANIVDETGAIVISIRQGFTALLEIDPNGNLMLTAHARIPFTPYSKALFNIIDPLGIPYNLEIHDSGNYYRYPNTGNSTTDSEGSFWIPWASAGYLVLNIYPQSANFQANVQMNGRNMGIRNCTCY